MNVSASHLEHLEEAVQRLRARLTIAEPLAEGWAEDILEDVRAAIREVQADLSGWATLYHEIMVEAEGAETVVALERGVIYVPLAVDLLPDLASGAWAPCTAIRLVACADGVFDLQVRGPNHPEITPETDPGAA